MTSTSVLGITTITVQFDLDRNIDARGAATSRRRSMPPAAQLPKNLPSPPTYRKVNPADAPILILAVQSDALPLTDGRRLRREHPCRSRSRRSPASAQVLIGGQQKPAVRVQVDPDKLAAMGITLEDVRNLLVNATVDAPEGHHRRAEHSPTRSRQRPAHARARAVQQRHHRLSQRRGGADRAISARAIDGPENRELAGWQNGKRGILLLVFKQPGANVIDTVERIKAALPRLEASIPPSIHVSIMIDRTQTIRASVDDVEFTLLLADRAWW